MLMKDVILLCQRLAPGKNRESLVRYSSGSGVYNHTSRRDPQSLCRVLAFAGPSYPQKWIIWPVQSLPQSGCSDQKAEDRGCGA